MSEVRSVVDQTPTVESGISPLHLPRGIPTFTTLVVGAALVAGVVFRLFYPGAIEFHSDEQFSFDHVMAVLNGGPWPPFGMTMSIGGPNAGMSVWIFILLGYLSHPETPVDLARAVQILNIAALGAFVVFILRAIPRAQREPWLWAAALWAVNPLAVVYERKIWPPCTLPIFMVGMIAGWWYRRTWLGSFAFAFIAVLCGQIHPTATFLGAVIFLWTLVGDWPTYRWRSFRITGLIAGGIVGVLPALNWFLAYHQAGATKLNKLRFPFLTFYGRWFSEPFGFGTDHTLGPVVFPDFLAWPEWNGRPIWLGLVLHLLLAVIALLVLTLSAWRLANRRRFSLRGILLGESPAGLLVRAAFFGFGTILTLLTITGGGLYPHYLVVIAPIMMLWLALVVAYTDGGTIASRGRALLSTICVIDGAIVVLLFAYIHAVGDIRGEFGPSWEWRQQQTVPLINR